MPKQQTLAKVEEDLALGRLGVARDRLQGLQTSFPEDMEIRDRLGDVYFRLGYPAEAGRCWFLSETPDERREEAVEAFLKSCGHDPDAIVKRLKLGIVLGAVEQSQTKDEVVRLVTEAYRRQREAGTLKSKGENKKGDPVTVFLQVGCLLVMILVVVFFFIGVVAFVQWTTLGR